MLNDHKKVIALIPARGGSKGVVRKNLRIVSGTPLIGYTLNAAMKSKYIDAVFVSSEDEEIIHFIQAFDISIVDRPAELASDTASAVDVVRHFLRVLPTALIENDPYIIYLQPTSPLRTNLHIDDALKMMESHNRHTLVSVKELKISPYKSFKLDDNHSLQSLFDEKLSNSRRQDLPKTYIPNGAIYVFRISDFEVREGFPSNGSLPYVMSEIDSIDIDTEDDIDRLESFLEEV